MEECGYYLPMLLIPSGSQVIIQDAAFLVKGFFTGSCSEFYSTTSPHLKETGAKTRSMARYGATYTYKGHPLPSYGFTPFLDSLRLQLQELLGVTFNAAVVNRYSDGNQGVAPHSDTRAIPQLGKQPVIAGVSFGAERPFVLQGLKKVDQPIVTQVAHGDLYVMHGNSQTHYRHSIPQVQGVVSPRWSVTYRFHETA